MTWLDELNPDVAPFKPVSQEVKAIRAGRRAVEAAEINLISAVSAARAADITWREVGMALGISPQAAQQRFGPDPSSVT